MKYAQRPSVHSAKLNTQQLAGPLDNATCCDTRTLDTQQLVATLDTQQLAATLEH